MSVKSIFTILGGLGLLLYVIENHVERLRAENYDSKSGVIFTGMVIDLERCADHAINIAFAIPSEIIKNMANVE